MKWGEMVSQLYLSQSPYLSIIICIMSECVCVYYIAGMFTLYGCG